MDRDNDQVNTQLEEENRYLKSLVIKGEEFADEMYEELLKCYDCFVKVENEIDDEECLGAIFDILEHQTAIEDKLMDLTVLRNEIKHEQGDFFVMFQTFVMFIIIFIEKVNQLVCIVLGLYCSRQLIRKNDGLLLTIFYSGVIGFNRCRNSCYERLLTREMGWK